jgi:hypothetical protein
MGPSRQPYCPPGQWLARSLPSSFGSFAMFAATRLASSRVSAFAVSARLGDGPNDEDNSRDHGIDHEKTEEPS